MVLVEYTYLFIVGAVFAFLDAWNIGMLASWRLHLVHPL
jgi:hypothetical protein